MATTNAPELDVWLRFRPDLEEEHERESRAVRVAMMRRVIPVGIVAYNVYGICCYYLLPDIYPAALAIRALLLTPILVLMMLMIPRLSLFWREFLPVPAFLVMIAVSIGLFMASSAPNAPYFLADPLLTLVYANMLLVLRFRFSLMLTLAAGALLAAGVLMKDGIEEGLRVPLIVQGLTGFVFTCYANWHVEFHRSRGFLDQRAMRQRADSAERLGERFRGLSLTDALTGLPNRRHLEEEFARRAAEGGTLTLMMVDIDHFKSYNDRLGHAAGDICLKRVSGGLAAYADETGGFVARYGGEEFTLLYEGEADAERAEGVIAAVRALSIGHPGRPDGMPHVTISLGLATAGAGRRRFSDLVTEADRALYEAKRAGRDRVRMAA